jgi:TRAP transporter TAXI family solute receptor
MESGRYWRSRNMRLYLGLALAAMLVALALYQVVGDTRQRPEALRISTGSKGGTYFALGGQLAHILSESGDRRIGRVVALPSAGSVQNAERIINGEADLSFVIGPVLASPRAQAKVQGLLQLYTNVAQVLVHKDARIRTLGDLRGKRVFAGAEGSGTEWLATKILDAVGIATVDYQRLSFDHFGGAEQALRDGQLDAAILITAVPVQAASEALNSHCCKLLSLETDQETILNGVPGVTREIIPAYTYAGQPNSIATVGSSVVLAASIELDKNVVIAIMDELFDNLETLAAASQRVQDIRIERSLEELKRIIPLHPGTVEFRERQKDTLLIATGAIGGRYFRMGKRMEEILRRHGIPTRVLQTDGSLENLEILAGDRPALAIVQYDAALASHWSPSLYRSHAGPMRVDVPSTNGLRRIATLHEEAMHVLVRRDKLPAKLPEKPTLKQMDGLRISLGPPRSGTALIARAMLREHGVEESRAVFLSVPDTLARLNEGEIDAAFFVSFVPNQSMRSAINDERNRLLSIDPRLVGALLGPTLTSSRIEATLYGSQWEDEAPVDTVSTWAVLVTTDERLDNIYQITRALFEGADYIGIRGGEKAMAKNLRGVPWHRAARAYCQEALPELCPRDKGFPWAELLGLLWRVLAILVILIAGYRGVVAWSRERNAALISKRILSVPLGPDYDHSAKDLLEIRREVRDRTQLHSWQSGQLDEARSRTLVELIGEKIEVAKLNLLSSLLRELRGLRNSKLDPSNLLTGLAGLEERIWVHLENGELHTSQHQLVLEFIRDRSQ